MLDQLKCNLNNGKTKSISKNIYHLNLSQTIVHAVKITPTNRFRIQIYICIVILSKEGTHCCHDT